MKKMLKITTAVVASGFIAACSFPCREKPFGESAVVFSAAIPDAKDRAKTQESVVNLFISAGDLVRAEQIAAGIPDWRRALSLCAIAEAYVSNNNLSKANDLLKQAEQVRNEKMDWYTERIDYQLARVYRLTGNDDRSGQFEKFVTPEIKSESLSEKVSVLVSTNNWDSAVELLQAVQKNPDFNVQCSVASGFLALAQKAADDGENNWCRTSISNLLDIASTLPSDIDAGIVKDAAAVLMKIGDGAVAVETVKKLSVRLTQSNFPPAGELNPLINLALAYHAIGETARAEEALMRSRDLCEQITAMDILVPQIPVAEAYLNIGEKSNAVAVYNDAVTRSVGMLTRPRYTALTQICLSLAVNHVHDDKALRNRIQEMEDGLL